MAGLGLPIIYVTFPDAGAAATFLGVGVSFVGAEVATFSVYRCVIRLQRDSLREVFALFGVVGWLFFPYASMNKVCERVTTRPALAPPPAPHQA